MAKKRQIKKPDITTRLAYFVAITQPFLTIPQVYDIWIKHQKGASLTTWAAYVSCEVVWLFYALKIKDKPLIITYVLWILFEALVVVGLVRS